MNRFVQISKSGVGILLFKTFPRSDRFLPGICEVSPCRWIIFARHVVGNNFRKASDNNDALTETQLVIHEKSLNFVCDNNERGGNLCTAWCDFYLSVKTANTAQFEEI